MNTYQDLKNYSYNLKRERALFFIQFYHIVYLLLIRPTPKFLYSWRRIIYRLLGANIGEGVRISSSAKLLYPWNIEIGEYSWIGDNVELYSVDKIIIGKNVALAHNIFVSTAAHDVYDIHFNTIIKPVIIEDEVWVAGNVFVNMGVILERGVVIGAGSIVTKNMPEGYMCVGNPARPIKRRR